MSFDFGSDPNTNPLTGPLPIAPLPKKGRRLRWAMAGVATLTIGAAAVVLLITPSQSQPQAVSTTTAPPTTAAPPTTVFVPSPALKQAITLSKCQASLSIWSVWMAYTYLASEQDYTNYDADLEAMPDWDSVYYSQDYGFLQAQSTAIVAGLNYNLTSVPTTVGNEVYNQCQSDLSSGYTSWPPLAFNDGMQKPIAIINGEPAPNPDAQGYDIYYLGVLKAAQANDPAWPDK